MFLFWRPKEIFPLRLDWIIEFAIVAIIISFSFVTPQVVIPRRAFCDEGSPANATVIEL